MHTLLHTYIHDSYIYAYMYTLLHTLLHTYIHDSYIYAYMHTLLYTLLYAYIHDSYIHAYTLVYVLYIYTHRDTIYIYSSHAHIRDNRPRYSDSQDKLIVMPLIIQSFVVIHNQSIFHIQLLSSRCLFRSLWQHNNIISLSLLSFV